MYGATPKTTDYAGEFIYENDTLRFINHEEGRILPDTASTAQHPWEYQYHLKDHLGNVRITFSEKTTTTQNTPPHWKKARTQNLRTTVTEATLAWANEQGPIHNY